MRVQFYKLEANHQKLLKSPSAALSVSLALNQHMHLFW